MSAGGTDRGAVTPPKHRLAILLSGRGSNFEVIADSIETGEIPEAEIVAVISDVSNAPGLKKAFLRHLPAHAIDRRGYASRADHERAIRDVLEAAGPDLICLAGYMRVLSAEFVAAYRGRILNIHPSLLPRHPGLEPHRRALESGDSESGCTVHYVDEGVDAGPIVLQRSVPVLAGDTEETLAARILEEEHRAYPAAIRKALGL